MNMRSIRWRDLLSTVAITLIFLGCGDRGSANVPSARIPTPAIVLTNTEWPSVHSDSAAIRDRQVNLRGRVYTEPVLTDKGLVFKAWVDFDNDQLSTEFFVPGVPSGIGKDDFVWVVGRVTTPAIEDGANGVDPVVEVERLTVTDRAGVRPARRILRVQQALEHNGVRVVLERVEFAIEEVRIYVSVENKGQEVLKAFGTGLRIELGETQIPAVIPVGKGLRAPRGLVEAGVTESGGFQFPPFDPEGRLFIVRWSNLGFEPNTELPSRWVWLIDPSGSIRPKG
jgi:hypothetical protein